MAQHRDLPRRLSTSKLSHWYDAEAIGLIDKVLVDGVHYPECVAYDMDGGWAIFKNPRTRVWMPRMHGKITVTRRGS